MNTQEIINAARQLPLEERRRVVSALQTDDVRQETEKSSNGNLDADARRRRQSWLKANRAKYAGQYVALDGDKFVGAGANYPEAAAAAKRAGVENAFVDFVRPPEYAGETGGW